jgi:phosphonate ABC transporter permease subunit PhnE
MLGAVIGLVLFSVLAQRLLASAELRVSPAVARAINFVLGGLSATLIVGLILALLAWLRDTPALEFAQTPALIAGVAGAVLTLLVPATRTIPVGNIIYYATRTFFNVVRAVEPLIYGIVFVIWVGLGPFAGTLALTLHTVATLGKLYSEQVENIMPGPIEAITATGANRLQTIVYGVIPQIVAPFISFTLYRWDVNVRSSTILGFVGGGGIGFILMQNIQLLKYRAASTNMLAIAIVVIILDYVSARVREKYV